METNDGHQKFLFCDGVVACRDTDSLDSVGSENWYEVERGTEGEGGFTTQGLHTYKGRILFFFESLLTSAPKNCVSEILHTYLNPFQDLDIWVRSLNYKKNKESK